MFFFSIFFTSYTFFLFILNTNSFFFIASWIIIRFSWYKKSEEIQTKHNCFIQTKYLFNLLWVCFNNSECSIYLKQHWLFNENLNHFINIFFKKRFEVKSCWFNEIECYLIIYVSKKSQIYYPAIKLHYFTHEILLKSLTLNTIQYSMDFKQDRKFTSFIYCNIKLSIQ